MIVYKGIRFAVRRYEYGGSGIVDTVGSLLVRYAIKAMLATSAKAALREPQLKKACVDTGGIDINALIDGAGIVLD